MEIKFILEFLVIIGALAMGARVGGVGLGLWGASHRMSASECNAQRNSEDPRQRDTGVPPPLAPICLDDAHR